MLLDEEVLEEEGLVGGFGEDVLEVGDAWGELLELDAVVGVLEVGAEAGTEAGGFADVDDLAFGVAQEVDAGPLGHGGESFAEGV